MTTDEFRKLGYELIDFIADYRDNVAEYPVMSQVKPGETFAALPDKAPEQGGGLANIRAELDAMIPALTNWQSPKFFAYFPANAELSSVLGDLVSSGLGQLGLNWQASPALSELEEKMTVWMRDLLGLPDYFDGVFQDTASTSSLLAMLCAREQSSSHSQTRGGLQAEEKPLIVYVSEQSHSSVEKAALLAGFGRDNIRAIKTDKNFALIPEILEQAIIDDLEKGYLPCAVTATTGTTATTALDPVAEIAKIAKKYKLWLHVDSAMAGSAMIIPEYRWMWEGVEEADSIVLNPHKWLGAVFDISLFFVRDSEHLIRVMSTNPSYLQTAADAKVKNYRDWGIPLGRRFRALKLWFLLRSEGADALRKRIERDIDNAKWLAKQIEESEDWELVAPMHLQTVCVRHKRSDLSEEENDEHNHKWALKINESGEAMLTPAIVDKKWMVRVSIGSLATERSHVERLWQTMQEAVL